MNNNLDVCLWLYEFDLEHETDPGRREWLLKKIAEINNLILEKVE